MKKGEKIAKQAAAVGKKKSGDLYKNFSSKMCWYAVVECAFVSGAVNAADKARLQKSISGTRFDHFVPFHAPIVKNLHDLLSVPPGSFLGFFRIHDQDLQLIHAMVFLGEKFGDGPYSAAGNKNDCIGIGESVGWEVLDLKELKWGGPFSFVFNDRPIQIRYQNMDGQDIRNPLYAS